MRSLLAVLLFTPLGAYAADYNYPPAPPITVYQPPPPVIVAPVDRCRHETVKKYDEDGDFQGVEEKEICD